MDIERRCACCGSESTIHIPGVMSLAGEITTTSSTSDMRGLIENRIVSLTHQGRRDSGHAPLTQCESKVAILWIAEGLSKKEVAGRLDLSTKTVDAHTTNIANKLGVSGYSGVFRYLLGLPTEKAHRGHKRTSNLRIMRAAAG